MNTSSWNSKINRQTNEAKEMPFFFFKGNFPRNLGQRIEEGFFFHFLSLPDE